MTSSPTTRHAGTFAKARASALRYVLGALLAFGALNAFGGGYYGLAGAKGIPTEWLEGNMFSDYFIPSLILLVVVLAWLLPNPGARGASPGMGRHQNG